MANRPLQLTLNGQPVGPVEVPDDLAMLDYLHEHQNLTGSRLGCGQGICHACVVIVDNPDGTSEEVRTCITGAHYFEGKKVRTIEGHAKQDEAGDLTLNAPGAINNNSALLYAGNNLQLLANLIHNQRGDILDRLPIILAWSRQTVAK